LIAILHAIIKYGKGHGMGVQKKVTVHIPEDLLARALEATGAGITPTIRRGLELVAAGRAYANIRSLRGKIDLAVNLAELREDSRDRAR
jgi:hypothetical protein